MSAFLWGSSLVVRKIAEDYLTPLFFNGMRFYAGFAFVLCVQVVSYMMGKTEKPALSRPKSYQVVWSIACGVILALASIFQQLGLYLTTIAITGFITTFYIILVPLISWLFLKKQISKEVWIGAVIAIAGLLFISTGGELYLSFGAIVVFCSAIFFALQILFISHCVQYTPVLLMSLVQTFTAATINLVASFLFEQENTLEAVVDAAWLIFYGGAICIGLAFVLYTTAMKNASPSIASIVVSLEAVFGAILGALILHEMMNSFQLFGSALIFIAIIVSQYERKKRGLKHD